MRKDYIKPEAGIVLFDEDIITNSAPDSGFDLDDEDNLDVESGESVQNSNPTITID